MREFLLYSHGYTGGKIGQELRLHGRLDIVAQCIRSAFFLSGSVRKDVIFHLSLNGPPRPPLYLKFNYATMTTRDVEKIIRRGLGGRLVDNLHKEKKSFQEIIRELSKHKDVYLLDKRGDNISSVKISNNPIFILGDDEGLNKSEKKFALRYGKKISLGPKMYMASQCISFLNIYLDNIFGE